MTPLFTKLNLGSHRAIVVLDPPDSFEPELAVLDGVTVHRGAGAVAKAPFLLAFVQRLRQVEEVATRLARTTGDRIVWFAYPKASSKHLACEFNRDTGWAAMGEVGFESVRAVAIDQDWSALRFRRTEFVKSLTRDRSRAATASGKARTRPRT